MAFTENARATGTQTLTFETAGTLTLTLNAAPAAGQWIVVAVYSNRGSPSSWPTSTIGNIQCGTQTLTLLDAGTTGTGPYIVASPYVSGMTTSITIPWNNFDYSTAVLGACALVFTGASTVTAPVAANYAYRQTTGAGLFDGGGTNTFGSGATAGVSGVVSWANSNNAIPTNYDSQNQPFIAAIVDTNVPTSTTLQLARSAGLFGVVSSGGLLYAAFSNNPGTLAINSSTGVYNPAGGTAYGVIYGTYGNFTFSYTGVSGNFLTGAVASGLGIFAQGPSYAPIMLAGTSAVTITSILNTTSATVPNLNGFLTGQSSYTFSPTASGNGHVQIGTGGTGTVPARLHLMGGTNNAGYTKQTAYGVQRINGSVATLGGGTIYTFAPATRTLTRTSSVSRFLSTSLRRSKLYNRLTKTSQFFNTVTSRSQRFSRAVTTTLNSTVKVTRIGNFSRRSMVGLVQTVQLIKNNRFNRSAKSAATALVSFGSIRRLNRSSRTSSSFQASTPHSRSVIRFFKVSQSESGSTTKTRSVTRYLVAGYYQTSRLISSKKKIRTVVTSVNNAIRSNRNSVFRRQPTVTQIVSVTVVRNRKYGRRVQVSSSYTVGTTRTRTLARRVIASSSAAVQISRKLGKSYLITVSSNVSLLKGLNFLIVSNAIWNSAKNTVSRLVIKSNVLVKQNIFINSGDWQQPNNGQPVPGTGPEAFDDAPETITETDDELGTSTIPFHE